MECRLLVSSTETITYIYSNKNILSEYKTVGNNILKKDYVNGLGIDDVISVNQEEVNLTSQEQEELTFCNSNVLTNTGGFVKYGWNTIVDRCNNLNASGSEIVSNTYYFHKDHLGSIVGITDNSGNLVIEYEYDVYGNSTLSGSDIGNDRLFTGREYDREINLYYFRARYYDSELGRFISRDPIGQIDDVNLYGYVGNNPIGFVDLIGTEGKPILISSDSANLIRSPKDAKRIGMIEMSPAKSIAHSLRIPFLEFNRKFISQDGHNELVFDYKTGELVSDSINRGTYNKYSPKENPILHLRYDYTEYILNGTSEGDPTDILERSVQIYKLTAIPAIEVKKDVEMIKYKINRFDSTEFIMSMINYFNY